MTGDEALRVLCDALMRREPLRNAADRETRRRRRWEEALDLERLVAWEEEEATEGVTRTEDVDTGTDLSA